MKLAGHYFLGKRMRSQYVEKICDVEITDALYSTESDWSDVIESHPVKADRNGIYHIVLKA